MSDTTGVCRAAILISGGGTNLQAFIDAIAAGTLDLDIALVLSNKADAYGLERAKKADIPTVCVDHTAFADRESFDRAMAERIDAADADLIVTLEDLGSTGDGDPGTDTDTLTISADLDITLEDTLLTAGADVDTSA